MGFLARIIKRTAISGRFFSLLPGRPGAGRVLPLMFHDLRRPDGTSAQPMLKDLIDYLSSRFVFVSGKQYLDYLDGATLPARPHLLLTFDDGYMDFATEVVPVLAPRRIPALLFPVPAFLNQPQHLMPLMEIQLLLQRPGPAFEWRGITIGDAASAASIWRSLRQAWRQTDASEQAEAMALFRAKRGGAIKPKRPPMLSWSELAALPDWIDIGFHTANHIDIDSPQRLDVLRYEIAENVRAFREHGIKTVGAFCFPFGEDLVVESRPLLEQHGMRCGFLAFNRTREQEREQPYFPGRQWVAKDFPWYLNAFAIEKRFAWDS